MKQVQKSTTTTIFRETDTINLAKEYLSTNKKLRILSFGCSIGDELATLRTLFPEAEIFGCDINPGALATANRTAGHMAEVFLSSEEEIAARGPFDLICAFASLCINPLPDLEVFRQQFSYAYFQELLELLDNHLCPGGILSLKNSSYPFSSTPIANRYHKIRSSKIYQNGFIPTINPNGNIALGTEPLFKRHDISNLTDWDFIDCVFRKQSSDEEPIQIFHGQAYQRPKNNLIPLTQWTRSNFDQFGIEENNQSNYIHIKTHYQTFASTEFPDQVFIEQETIRSSLHSSEALQFQSGRWC